MTNFAFQKALVLNPVFEGGQAVSGHQRHEGLMRLVLANVSLFFQHPSITASLLLAV